MSAMNFETGGMPRQSASRLLGSRVEVTPALIAYYVAQGKRQRSEVIVGGLARACGSIRRLFAGRPLWAGMPITAAGRIER